MKLTAKTIGFLLIALGLSLCLPKAAYADFVIPLFEPIMGIPLFLFVILFEMLIFGFLCRSVVKINISSSDCYLIVLVANVASFACGSDNRRRILSLSNRAQSHN